ncbi:DUF1850 domain-containing protein [Lentibacillus sp.]|uniref:DUF1850 domain-containing protein n=1 Tax=Lentibacillus sp. TaxID=1925746 RepID=UPI002B4B8B58|nr:DUF1850 domain-containing protein [Lentibacillus sp.]HLS09252.1 DUF1850 domain-containing protein [Lentibacillus sp.]
MFRKHKAAFSAGLAVLMVFGVAFIPVKALTVLNGEQPIYAFYLTDHSFSVQWKHSVEKEEWVEYFRIQDNTLFLESTKFKTFGAGVPSISEHPAVLKDGWVHIDIDRKIGHDLVVRSNRVNNYQIQFADDTYDLKPSDEAYTVTVSETPLYVILFTFLKHIVR